MSRPKKQTIHPRTNHLLESVNDYAVQSLEGGHDGAGGLSSRVIHLSKPRNDGGVRRARGTVNKDTLRLKFVLGKRRQLEDGTWVSEDYTHREFAEEYGLSKYYVDQIASQEAWHKLRKAYLARVSDINIGQELSLYTTENFQAEISAINACNKLGVVLDKYIDTKFGDILDAANSTDTNIPDEAAGVNVNELKEAINVAKEIYTLQRKIYENAPKTGEELINEVNQSKPKFRTPQERKAKIKSLEAIIGKALSTIPVTSTPEQITPQETEVVDVEVM